MQTADFLMTSHGGERALVSLPVRVLIPSQGPSPQADHLTPPNTVPLRVRASAGSSSGSVVKNPPVVQEPQEPQETQVQPP